MAKYTIDYVCGHSDVQELYGPEKDRAKKIALLEKQPCLTCKRKQETENAIQQAQTLGLVTLTGTENLVDWALRVRSEFIAEMEPTFTSAEKKEANGAKDRQGYTTADARAAFIRVINCHTEAKWWIDNRMGLRRLIAAEYREEFTHA